PPGDEAQSAVAVVVVDAEDIIIVHDPALPGVPNGPIPGHSMKITSGGGSRRGEGDGPDCSRRGGSSISASSRMIGSPEESRAGSSPVVAGAETRAGSASGRPRAARRSRRGRWSIGKAKVDCPAAQMAASRL